VSRFKFGTILDYQVVKIAAPFSSVSDPYWSQYGSESSLISQYKFGSRLSHNKILQNWRRYFFLTLLFTNSSKNLHKGLLGSRKNHQPSTKMINALLKLKSLSFSFFIFGLHFDCPYLDPESVFPVRIQIQRSQVNTDPHVSGSETPPFTFFFFSTPSSYLYIENNPPEI
jgi:hypothetical protein